MTRYSRAPKHFKQQKAFMPKKIKMKDMKDLENKSPITEHGFDLTTFKSKESFKKTLRDNKISTTPKKTKSGYLWKGKNINVVTANNPITGEYYRKDYRQKEIGYASYIGVKGEEKKVTSFVKSVRKNTSDIKEEGENNYISVPTPKTTTHTSEKKPFIITRKTGNKTYHYDVNKERYVTAKEVKKGAAIEEKEHHLGKKIDTKIATDHIKENPEYYKEPTLNVGDTAIITEGPDKGETVTIKSFKDTTSDSPWVEVEHKGKSKIELFDRLKKKKGVEKYIHYGTATQKDVDEMNKNSDRYSFQMKDGKILRFNKDRTLEEQPKQKKTWFEQQPAAYQAKVKAEEQYYNTADTRYEKNLAGRKVLHEGHDSDLVEETPTKRVWVSRVTGEIEREKLVDGRWEME